MVQHKEKVANTITTWAMFATVMTQVLPQQDDQFCHSFTATTKVQQKVAQSKLGEFAPLGNNKFANKAETNKLDFVKDEKRRKNGIHAHVSKFKLE